MLITCPRCQTVFQLADEMLPADISSLKMRCARCQMVFSPPAEEIVPPTGPGGDDLPVEEDLSTERLDFPSDIPASSSSGSEGDEAAENELPEEGSVLEELDVQVPSVDELQEHSGDDLMDAGEDAETTTEPSSEDDLTGEEATVEKDAEDIVFELADDFEDDLSWDIDDDEEHQATSVPGKESESRQTAMDEDGLSVAAGGSDDDLGSRSDGGEKTVMSAAGNDFQPEATAEDKEAVKPVKDPGQSRRTLLYLGFIFIVLSLAVWGGMLLWQKFSIDMEKHLSIVGLESRNYIFSPDKRVIAIRGKLYNTSPKIVGKLKIKGVIVDRQGNVLAEKFTSGGVTFSAEELQNLNEETVEKLENPAAVVPANGGELPFMLVFYGYPPSASSYHVELAEFSILKKGKNP